MAGGGDRGSAEGQGWTCPGQGSATETWLLGWVLSENHKTPSTTQKG